MESTTTTAGTTEGDTRRLVSSGAPLFGHLPPAYAAYFRGLLLAVLLAALEAAARYLEGAHAVPGTAAVAIPVLVLLLRTLEGLIDQRSVSAAPASPSEQAGP